MKTTLLRKCGFFLTALLVTALVLSAAHSDVGLMTKEELKTMLDNPDVVILDVRKGKDWTSSEFKIQGAAYAKPQAFAEWVSTYPKNKTYVLYCA